MPRDAAITARVEKAVKEALVTLAEEDGRPHSQYLERLILIHLQEMNRLPKMDSKAGSGRGRLPKVSKSGG